MGRKSDGRDSEKTEEKSVRGRRGSERGVVGKSSVKGKKSWLDKQTNIRETRRTKEKTDLQ